MKGYWIRHRLLLTIIMSAAIALITGLLFVFPYIGEQANNYNAQSVYKNTNIDFIAPEPSFEQVDELSGTNGVNKVFPFYLTKTQVSVNGSNRTTTVLLSDQFQNIDMTMYNDSRLIKKADSKYDNSILVDWQFCKDTSSTIGDVVSLSIDGQTVEYRIYAIYETNTIYEGGAILAQITSDQKKSIMQKSKNSGYSGMYISASDYGACRTYLTTDYRPLGRLKSRDQFESDDQYQVHYDAIMASSYSNEITDFRTRESGLAKKNNPLMIYIGAALAAVLLVTFNLLMSKRGCEKVYFTKHCIPKGMNVKSYYSISFVLEVIFSIAIYCASVICSYFNAKEYIPMSVIDYKIAIIPAVVIVAGLISLIMNNSMVASITKKVNAKKEGNKQEN